MADGAIHGRKLDLTYTLGKFAWIVETFLSEKRSIQSKLCVKLANVSNERDSMAPISITRALWSWILFQGPYSLGQKLKSSGSRENNYAIQTRKFSQYIARSAGKLNRINFLEGNFPQDYLYLGISFFVYLRTMSSLRLSVLCPN